MIRILVVDDHPALRAGLHTVLDAEPGLVFVGESAGDEESLWPALNHTRPDVVLLDYHLPRGDGIQLCYRIKHQPDAPRVIVLSAYASPQLALPARLARADALLSKALGARELFAAIRRVNRWEPLLPPVSATVLSEAMERFEPEERALVGMLLDGATEPEVAQTLRMERSDLRHTVHRILRELRLDIPAAATL
jgi:DNA-binding NarL/FixJ family response regulator